MNDEIKVRQYTNFNNDVYEYGPIGEEALCKHLIESNKHYINVSKLTEFQPYDVDIIQINDNNIQTELYLDYFKNNVSLKKLNAISYEVKTDTYGLKSRNIVWEVFSNSNNGCMSKSKADYLYYVFINNNKEVVEEYMINMKKIRWWLMSHFDKINQTSYLKSKSMRRGKDNTGILLINVDHLVNENIAIKIK